MNNKNMVKFSYANERLEINFKNKKYEIDLKNDSSNDLNDLYDAIFEDILNTELDGSQLNGFDKEDSAFKNAAFSIYEAIKEEFVLIKNDFDENFNIADNG
ncbi:hypothetical protein HGG64_01710 [Mycoplasma phocoeninasale]|uniref:Uncharacterized protein n=1 Tax=Mycoplasma phocoeninasale TaxID=2726117 RepID=A0A858U1Y6_9MOLU|nr:hypothetical protein [Mycoplasma phocoeninasale]QJG66422.1 hypothetical protein HGG64_01710 [Mycoplasma phocoeninasale]